MLAKLVVQVIGSTLVAPLLRLSVTVAGSTGAGALPITKFTGASGILDTIIIGAGAETFTVSCTVQPSGVVYPVTT